MKNTNFEYVIDQDANCIFVKHHGPITKEHVIQRGEGVAEDKAYRPNLNRMIDVRGCNIELSTDDMSCIAELMKDTEQNSGIFTEILLVDSLLAHGVVRMMMSFVSQKNISYIILHTSDADLETKLYASLGLPSNYPLPDFIQISEPEISVNSG